MHPALFIVNQFLCQAPLMPGSSQKAELPIMQLFQACFCDTIHGREGSQGPDITLTLDTT